MRLPAIDLYSQKNVYKIFIGINVALIGLASLIYTYNLVGGIETRERRLVTLLAQLIEIQANQIEVNEESTKTFTMMRESIMDSGIPFVLVNNGTAVDGINIEMPANVPDKERSRLFQAAFLEMKDENPPIFVNIMGANQAIYYGDSPLLVRVRYFPYIQILSILVLAVLAYLVFSSSRTAEQNRVWVGLAKETAHQLGTPIASLMGWVEFFGTDPDRYPPEYVAEILKDIRRLEMITARFSSIGSVPTLKNENVGELVSTFLDYLKKRISTKVQMEFVNKLTPSQELHLNRYLFEWVIENLCKNAVDAMGGIGHIKIKMHYLKTAEIAIDITDSGKGIPRSQWKKVFGAGFSTKKRGWGLGLTLAKRIIEEYHRGKLFVKSSELGKGTTFRVVMPAKK